MNIVEHKFNINLERRVTQSDIQITQGNHLLDKLIMNLLYQNEPVTIAGYDTVSISFLRPDGTICGAIRQILDYLTANHPKAQIIMTQVTPSTSNNNDVFTKAGAGGWTLTDHKAEVSALCAKYGVPYIDWEGCTYMRHWADFSGAGGNWAHPNNEEAYIQMGNYLAGRISSYYSG